MSDPSIVMEQPNTNWRSNNLQVSQSRHMSRRGQTIRTRNKIVFPPLLDHHVQTLLNIVESLKDLNILI